MAETWITSKDSLRALVTADRLRAVTVRYRGTTEGRFTAPAQDVPDLVGMLEQTGRYVRDMFTHSGSRDRDEKRQRAARPGGYDD